MTSSPGLAQVWPWPPGDDAEVDCAVVGSGFGASVAAARLSQTPGTGRVVVLERGREVRPGEFPRTPAALLAQVRTPTHPFGLVELVIGPETGVLVSAALGGGSLFYAAVLLEPRDSVFARGWPTGIDRAELAPYYDTARMMLGAEPYLDADDAHRHDPNDPALSGSFAFGRSFDDGVDRAGRSAPDRPVLPKTRTLHRLEDALGPGSFRKVPLGINITRVEGTNEFGAEQRKCTLCGNCCLGCNVGAKNTLGHNYLQHAANRGAEVFTGIEITRVEPSERPGRRWCLRGIRRHERDGQLSEQPIAVHARTVVLGAGALGTVGILQRSSALALSPRLGAHFSGNGDTYFVTQGGDSSAAVSGPVDLQPDSEVGPVITAALDLRDHDGLMLQDGALPAVARGGLHAAAAAELLRHHRLPSARRRAELVDSSQIWLLMGYDAAGGALQPGHGASTPRWPDLPDEPMWSNAEHIVSVTTHTLGSSVLRRPRPNAGSIIVHALGGAAMADDVDHGVTDPFGRVFDAAGHILPGLVVSDASLIPTALGANPSLTITAVAERNVLTTIADHLDRP